MRAQLLIIVLVVGCTPTRKSDEPLPPVDSTRISHAQHVQVPCDGCHRSSDSRPGIDQHKPCDDGACHRKDFLAPPGRVCSVCHKPITSPPLVAELRKYPSDDLW